ncbi:MAG TPA: Na+/H+ antiporter subunit E [Clostridia bacterium]|nr:Na+/H+ antiporter subunit E [Clostridia bacterium]
MSIQLWLNFFIAFLWMQMKDEWSTLNFFSGYLVGMGLIFMFRRFFAQPFYLGKLWSAFKLFLIFVRELVLSGIFVIQQTLKPEPTYKVGIVPLKTKLESDVELTLISLMITLTPGSVVLGISPDRTTLYVHAMGVPDATYGVMRAGDAFEAAIMEVTRG